MSEKDNLMNKIRMYDFIITEMILYLDTHPNCQDGLAYFNKYRDLSQKAHNEYIQRFGPIKPLDVNITDKWTWINEPWPWEREANL